MQLNKFQTQAQSNQSDQPSLSQTQSSHDTQNLIASSFQLPSMTTLANNISPRIPDHTFHNVSPNIQDRITAFLSNNRNNNNRIQLNDTPVRRNLRPRNNTISYIE